MAGPVRDGKNLLAPSPDSPFREPLKIDLFMKTQKNHEPEKKNGIEQVPVIFFSSPAPVLDTSRSDVWRPLIGGVLASDSSGTFTLGFAATRNGQNGVVTVGHIGTVGTTVYQAFSPNAIGKVTVSSGGISSDSSWIRTSNIQGKIYESSASQASVWSYTDPWAGACVSMAGIATDYARSGRVVCRADVWNGEFSRLIPNQWHDYSAQSGDSGAPVYINDSQHRIQVSGIHWGRTRYSIFSPVSGVMSDLGVQVIT
jgi:hypothetical protein